ncbi:hypothetical protein LTR84_005426 [Exophiala bonariae]|uniref:Rhodopsin domain-containing protein n=1 Tax=Exophiala bonariae TaxID=1690606 RepID=A0AAV9N609_9EURO|nr:hypothetical protein LTR84_005426 [Exophiala bonariae]
MSGLLPLELMPGQSPPIAIVTPTDQRGVLWIVTWFCLATAVVSLLIRVYVRIAFSQSYGKDDISIFGAFISFIVQSSIAIYEVRLGVGQTLQDVRPENLQQLQKAYYISDLFYVITIWIAKCSVILLLLRLTAKTEQALVANIILFATIVLGVVSLLITALSCDLSSPWIFIGKQCSGLAQRRKAVAAFDIFTELSLFATLVLIVSSVQLRLSKKLAVILGFTFRLLLFFPLGFRLHYILAAIDSADPTLKSVNVVITSQVQLSAAIVSATIPCLRPFMAATYTTWGGRVDTVSGSGYQKGAYGSGKEEGSHLSQGTKIKGFLSRRIERSQNTTGAEHSQDIALEPLATRRKKESQGWEEIASTLEDQGSKQYSSAAFDEREHEYDSKISTGNLVQEDQQSSDSHDSQRMIIRRDLEWSVRYEHRPSLSGDHIEEHGERARRF